MKNLKEPEVRRIIHSCEDGIHLCHCCALDVMAQGPTEFAARRNLTEVVMLLHESCTELGSRDELFRELGFHETSAGLLPPARCYSRCCPCQPEGD